MAQVVEHRLRVQTLALPKKQKTKTTLSFKLQRSVRRVVPAVGRLRLEDHKFKLSLYYLLINKWSIFKIGKYVADIVRFSSLWQIPGRNNLWQERFIVA
jgi:hypothetical protein